MQLNLAGSGTQGGFSMTSKWSYLVTFIFFLLIPSLCGAKSELSKTITVCGTSEGYTYTLESPFTASDFLGWNKDTVQSGEIRFVIRDGKPDIILRDVLPRTTSLRKIGGKVEVLSDGSKSGITTVLVVFPDGTIHHYLFQIDKSGNGQVVWGAATGYGIPPKSFLMRAQCKSE